MDILIQTNGIEPTDSLQKVINRKIGRVRQYAPMATRARVQLHKVRISPSPQQFVVRVHYEIPGNDLHAEHSAHDPIVALDLVAEKGARS